MAKDKKDLKDTAEDTAENLEEKVEDTNEKSKDAEKSKDTKDKSEESEESIALSNEKAKEKAKKKAKTQKAKQKSSGSIFKSSAFRNISLVVVSALVGAGITYAVAGSKTTEATKLVSMKGDTITVSDLYDRIKTSSGAQQGVLSLTLEKVFDKQYGDKVSNDDVEKAYDKMASTYGESFSSVLSAYGYTEEGYKAQIRLEKLIEYATKKEAEKYLTDENYKAAYDDYNPDTKVQVVSTTDENVAKAVQSAASADGADFSTAAKDNGAEAKDYTIDSASTELPDQVMSAAFDQDAGKVSDVVSVTNSSNYSTTYYVVKTVSKSEKNSDWKTYKDKLKEIIINEKTSDTNFQNSVISKALEKANVKIVDDSYSSILDQYATSSSSSSSSSSASSSSAASSSTSSSATSSASSESSK